MSEAAVAAAVDALRVFGELPEERRLAEAVAERALTEPKPAADATPPDLFEGIRRLKALADAWEAGTLPVGPTDHLRRHLYAEALDEDELVRWMARRALIRLAAQGRDVTRPLHLDDAMGMPKYGTAGMHVLGFPLQFIPPQYRGQGRRVMKRLATIRKRRPQDEDAWIEMLTAAGERFSSAGELPSDALLRDAVLAHTELEVLLRPEVDPELAAAFDRAGRAHGSQHQEALQAISAHAAAGRLAPGCPGSTSSVLMASSMPVADVQRR